MQDPLGGESISWGPCNEGVWGRHWWQSRRDEERQFTDWGTSLSLKGSPLPNVTQRLCSEGKQPQPKERTDRQTDAVEVTIQLLIHAQGFIRVTFKYSALMDTIIPFPTIECIKFPRGNSWNYQRSHVMTGLPVYNQRVLVSNVIKESPSEVT